jgi:predicted ATP-binding protein involved in virulence
MAKKYLHSIELQNFKAFADKAEITLNGKNALIWGVNGSGKSSVYWAIYTFLQCSTKGTNGQVKYFDKGDLSLHNILAPEDRESYIKLAFKEQGSSTIDNFKLSVNQNESLNDFIRGVDNSSEFITHRLLLNFYHYKHSQKINLYPVFDRDIFPYFKTSKGNSFRDLLKKMESNLAIETKKNLELWEKEFNDGLEDLIQPIKRNEVNQFYNKFLALPGETIDIQIHFPEYLKIEGFGKDKKNRTIKYPEITLKAQFGLNAPLKPVNKPQSFFNEARINAIALSVRFVLMKGRKSAENLNLLVLDDLLISLDMHNRMKVTKMIIDEYSKDYQIIIFTHDKGFFNEVVRKVDDKRDDWQIIRFYETPIDKNPKIEYDNSSNLDKAIDSYIRHDYEGCALHLRKEAEDFLAKYMDPELSFIWKQKEWKGLADFLSSAEKKHTEKRYSEFKKIIDFSISADHLEKLKTQIEVDAEFSDKPEELGPLLSYKRKVFELIKTIKEEQEGKKDIISLLGKVNNIKDRTLNAGAHFSEAPLFKEEIEEAIETIIELKKAIGNQVVKNYIKRCQEAGMKI